MKIRWHSYREVGLALTLIAWIGVAFYFTNVLEPEMRLKLSYEERIAQIHQEDRELGLLEKRVVSQEVALVELEKQLRKTKCQIQMVVAASRAGWRKAEKLMQIGAFQRCGTDAWNPDILQTDE
jgi:hypothetical protein